MCKGRERGQSETYCSHGTVGLQHRAGVRGRKGYKMTMEELAGATACEALRDFLRSQDLTREKRET